jgi:hypothetical protein
VFILSFETKLVYCPHPNIKCATIPKWNRWKLTIRNKRVLFGGTNMVVFLQVDGFWSSYYLVTAYNLSSRLKGLNTVSPCLFNEP